MKDQVTKFPYLKWQQLYEHEKPFKLFVDLPAHVKHQRRTNLVFEPHEDEIVHDVRDCTTKFRLDVHGFQFAKHTTNIQDFSDASGSMKVYFQEVEDLIKANVNGVERVHVFDWRLRMSMDENEFIKRRINLSNPSDPILPAVYPHIDQTGYGALSRVKHHLPGEGEKLLSEKRFRIINVWRPLKKVENWPLAFCDRKSVQKGDLIAADFVRRDYAGETYFLKYSPDYKWHYMSDQERDDVVLFKIYDSSAADGDIGCPHASFRLGEESVLPPRESVEVRAFVFSQSV
ncbi:hypothetical protein F4820DRAFT_422926 [Hypoxylon rubiginosum]|uniref:Uncharacterized protein n=1 Tax=Hypoxylon rubiginosum TaxID=110542 RepID=A0ACB9YYW7_9PEZI|nr:hypothetical protein F4820DRAFT_422926 [Hypoxylon rubiginosum]